MFQPQTTIAWGGALLLGIGAAAFLVSWVLTDRLHLRRTPYVGALAALTAALAASAGVIVVHHLGYREFRGPAMRSALVGCMPLSLAYLATASPIAAIGGHIIIHLAVGITSAEATGSADAPVTARPTRA